MAKWALLYVVPREKSRSRRTEDKSIEGVKEKRGEKVAFCHTGSYCKQGPFADMICYVQPATTSRRRIGTFMKHLTFMKDE